MTKSSAGRRGAQQMVEECWILVGQHCGRIWFARMTNHCEGKFSSVEFDGTVALEREEHRRDVVGFFHTHPTGSIQLSQRDVLTMRAWVSSFGKPMLCVVKGEDELAGYRFDNDESNGEALVAIETFKRGAVVGVEADGR